MEPASRILRSPSHDSIVNDAFVGTRANTDKEPREEVIGTGELEHFYFQLRFALNMT